MDFQNYLNEALPKIRLNDDRPKEPLMRTVGHMIKAYRKKAGLTQKQLASRSGLAQSYISNLERGTFNICLKQLERVLDALDTHIEMEVIPNE